MEWVEGSNLRECLTVREPNIDETLQLIISLTDAVSHAHERGILHRDIKPSNIIVCGKEFKQIKLCDFGLAKMKAGRPGWSSGTELIGTPGYMAPETIRNEIGKVGPAVDVFSIGVVMYRLLNGKMPFDGINPISLGIQVLYHEPQSIRSIRYEVPEQLEAICLKCLSKEPDERYPDAIALRADLDRFVKGKPVHATRSNYFHRIKRWARREPRLAALTGLFVCFMAITIAILGILLDKSRASEEKAIQNANQARMNGEIASRNANEAERRLVESVKAMSLASPVFKRILNEYRLNPDEIKKITEFAKLRENLDAEAIDLKERLNHHFLTLELADCLRRIKGEERNAIELAALARQKIGKLISEDGKAASKAEYGSIPSENFRISVLEKALLRYGQACSQLQASYPRPIAFGL
jgi:serine/threonine protein kinase